MGDAALSQDEIDSLLAGLDGGASPGGGGRAPSSALAPQEVQAFKAILDSTVDSQSQNLSVITGQSASIQPPAVDAVNRDAFLRDLPEEVLAVTVPFAGSLPGEHLFVMSKNLALAIAANANNEAGLAELDDMAISAVQECISNLTGTEINVLSDKTANRGIQSGVAEGSFGPKAMVRVPSGDMVRAVYQVQIGGGPPERMVELFGLAFAKDVLAASGGGLSGAGMPMGAPMMAPSMGAPARNAPMNGGMGQAGAMGQMGGMAAMGGFGAPTPQYPPMGGMGGMQGYGSPMNPPNVQPIQFASLPMQQGAHESGNIGLIMDVFMEMTVELGRTKKLIKEILGMGEGTIIELDKLAGEPVDILVNHKLIAKGEVVVIDENFGVRVTEIVSPAERMADLT